MYAGPDTAVLEKQMKPYANHLKHQVHMLGVLAQDELSRLLQATDLMLYPLDDGASARRGALMAAMQHGAPILSTSGPSTDMLIRQCPNLHLAISASDFTDQLLSLAQRQNDPHSPEADAMRRFFGEHYDWPQLAETMLPTLKPLENEAHVLVV